MPPGEPPSLFLDPPPISPLVGHSDIGQHEKAAAHTPPLQASATPFVPRTPAMSECTPHFKQRGIENAASSTASSDRENGAGGMPGQDSSEEEAERLPPQARLVMMSSVSSCSNASPTPTKLRSTAPEYRPRQTPPSKPATPAMRASAWHNSPAVTTPQGHHHHLLHHVPTTPSASSTPLIAGSSSVPMHGIDVLPPSLYGEFFVDYVLVVDFEATCEDGAPDGYLPEIIEFPVVVVDAAQRKVIGEFHSFVRPTEKPMLTQFCKDLTGISQEQVTAAPPLQMVVEQFDEWLTTIVPEDKTFIFATDGPWDMRDFMYHHSVKTLGVRFPPYFYRWIDVKEAFAEHYCTRRGKIAAMLDFFGLDFEGRLHSGIDDARNIARIFIALLDNGCAFPTIDEIETTPPRAHLRRHHHRLPVRPSPGSSLTEHPNSSFALPPPQRGSSSSRMSGAAAGVSSHESYRSSKVERRHKQTFGAYVGEGYPFSSSNFEGSDCHTPPFANASGYRNGYSGSDPSSLTQAGGGPSWPFFDGCGGGSHARRRH